MAKEICISSTPHETRLAILEDDQLAEIYYERENEYTLAGSIYNGRVTRVLPGMQSAFVDLGLERDAFLYVTDFLELEDQEESDELEKAAQAGGNQPPREVRRGNGQQRAEARHEARPDRESRGGYRDRRAPAAEAPVETPQPEPAAPEIPALSGEVETEVGEQADGGAKRWRGRRRRRGGRGIPTHVSDPVESETSAETYLEPSELAEPDVAHEIHAEAVVATETPAVHAAPAPRAERSTSQFVLPGESLSKYGGERAPETPRAEALPAAPPRPASTFKPATLIESPIEWDGSGLLPGESLSRHRRPEPEPEAETATVLHGEPQGVFADAAHAIPAEEDLSEETEETIEYTSWPPAEAAGATEEEEHASGAAIETTEVSPEEELDTEELVMEEQPEEPLPGASVEIPDVTVPEPVAADPFSSDPFFSAKAAPAEGASEEGSGEAEPRQAEGDEPEGNRSASHHVDPLPPSEFRLSTWFGGKKKSEELTPPPQPEPVRIEPEPGTVKSVSAFSPGTGLVEEEVIEGEEFEAPHHHSRGKTEERDLDEYEEEEKVHTQIRTGELGEMLQEAHLDHRIQLNFDDKTAKVEGEDVYDIEDEEEEEGEAETETVPAGNGVPAPHRRDPGGRGRPRRGAPG